MARISSEIITVAGLETSCLNESHPRLPGSEDRSGGLNYLTIVGYASKLSLLEVKIENLVALRIYNLNIQLSPLSK